MSSFVRKYLAISMFVVRLCNRQVLDKALLVKKPEER